MKNKKTHILIFNDFSQNHCFWWLLNKGNHSFSLFENWSKWSLSLLDSTFWKENCSKIRKLPSTDSSNVSISRKTKILVVVNCFGKSFSKTVNCREFGLFRTWNTRTKVQEAGERCEKFGKILRNMTMPEGWSYSLKSYHEPSFRIAVLHKRRFSQFARYRYSWFEWNICKWVKNMMVLMKP